MRTVKNLYKAAELEIVRMLDADVITTSGIVDTGSDPDVDAGYGNVPMEPDNWDT